MVDFFSFQFFSCPLRYFSLCGKKSSNQLWPTFVWRWNRKKRRPLVQIKWLGTKCDPGIERREKERLTRVCFANGMITELCCYFIYLLPSRTNEARDCFIFIFIYFIYRVSRIGIWFATGWRVSGKRFAYLKLSRFGWIFVDSIIYQKF